METERQTNVTISNEVRWLVGATGCAVAVAGCLSIGFGFLAIVIFQIAGAVVAGRFPRTGEALIAFGATFLSLSVLPYGIGIVLSFAALDHEDMPLITGAAAVLMLVVMCDVALVKEGLKIRRIRRAGKANADPSSI
jgi:hypothetical protein